MRYVADRAHYEMPPPPPPPPPYAPQVRLESSNRTFRCVSRLGLVVVRRSAGNFSGRTQVQLPASALLSLRDNCDLWTLSRDFALRNE